MAISFQTGEIKFKLQEPAKLKAWIKKTIASEKKKTGQINFVFTNDAKVLDTNIRYLDHDTYTDIITFDYCENETIHGDIIISIERVRENADKFKTPFETELRRVIIHGILHLCGYKDKTKKDTALMREKENEALKKIK